MAALGNLAKLKRGLGQPFDAPFLHVFFVKMFLNSLLMDKVSMSHLNPLSKYLILKRISCMQWLLWVFSKIKKGSGASFWCTFSVRFFCKNVPYLILYYWTKFQCHSLIFSQDIKQNVLLSSYLDN